MCYSQLQLTNQTNTPHVEVLLTAMNKTTKSRTLLKHIAVTTLCTAIGFSAFAAGAAPKADAATARSKMIISSGKKYLGVPYRFGAPSGVTYAFDCSSFIQYVFKRNGLSLPRTSAAQAKVGKKVPKGSLSQGDLVFFNTNGRSISHAAIYAGYGKILHSSSSRGVAITNMNSNYWKTKYVTARRVL